MANGNSNGGSGNPLMKAIGLLATALSGVATFLLAPLLYGSSAEWVKGYAISNYGAWTEGLIAFAWFLACGVIVFSICRIGMISVLWLGHLFLASSRFGR